jgi:uncharacterized iron-regulated membrane protein
MAGVAARLTFTRVAFRIHGWLGLATGLLLLVVASSGAVLVFAAEINEALWRDLLVVPPGPVLGHGALYEAVRRGHPGAQDIAVRHLARPGRSAVFSVGEGGRGYRLFVDPRSGQILGRKENGRLREDPMGWLVQLHFTLMAGKAGYCAVGFLSVLLLGSITTGLVVYRRFLGRVLLMRVSIRWRDWRRALSDLHRVVGVWAWLFNLLIAATGLWFMRQVFTPGFYGRPAAERGPAPRLAVSLDRLLATAGARVPAFHPLGLWVVQGPPGRARAVVLFGADRGRFFLQSPYDSRVTFDASTGALSRVELISRAPWPAQVVSTTGPLHFGSWGGLRVKVVYAACALAPPLLSISGFMLWLRRRRGRPD